MTAIKVTLLACIPPTLRLCFPLQLDLVTLVAALAILHFRATVAIPTALINTIGCRTIATLDSSCAFRTSLTAWWDGNLSFVLAGFTVGCVTTFIACLYCVGMLVWLADIRADIAYLIGGHLDF